MHFRRLGLAASLFLAAAMATADAHVELTPEAAIPGATVRVVFTVGHGCAGGATTALRVLIDQRLGAAEAEAKAGWIIEAGDRDAGANGAAPVFSREIRWIGGSLSGHDHGEFALTVQLPQAEAGTVIFFPVVQECGTAVQRWIETPLPGERPDALAEPAPFLTIEGVPAAHAP